jgi:hypothetical protein
MPRKSAKGADFSITPGFSQGENRNLPMIQLLKQLAPSLGALTPD